MLVLVGGYALFSWVTWQGYEGNYTQWQASIKSQTDEALWVKDPSTKLAALKNLSKTLIGAKDTVCSAHVLIKWQEVLKSIKEREEKCQQALQRVSNLSKKLQATTQYLEEEKALGNVLTSVPHDKDRLPETDWQAQATAWHTAAQTGAKLSAHDSFSTTKQAAVATLQKIDAAWQEVLAAHTAKDKARFLQAQASLVQEYGGLGEITTISTNNFQALLDELQKAYNTAF